jgi:hypothetical protein
MFGTHQTTASSTPNSPKKISGGLNPNWRHKNNLTTAPRFLWLWFIGPKPNTHTHSDEFEEMLEALSLCEQCKAQMGREIRDKACPAA